MKRISQADTRSLLGLAAINLAVLALSALAILAAAEIYLRLTVPGSSRESIYLYTLDTPRYKVMKPNASVITWGKELKTNELGFRDEAAAVPPKQPGELRVAVLGDSFTVSAGVDYRRIYTTLLRERLKQRDSSVSLVNLAVGGYNIVQYAMVLEEVALRLQPDMVLVGVFPDNDFDNGTYEANFRAASGRPDPDPAWYEELYVHRAYLGRIGARLKKMLASGAAEGGPSESTVRGGEGWEDNVAALRRIADIARREHLQLKVALLPHTWNFDKQRELFARVEAACRQHDLPCLNLLEPFIARGVAESSLRLNALDAHPNEKYNALVAEELMPHVSRALAALRSADGVQYARLPARGPAPGAGQ